MNIESTLENYLNTLREKGAAFPEVIQPLDDPDLMNDLAGIEGISIPDQFGYYLEKINGYDLKRCRELDVIDPVFAWNKEVKPLKRIISYYKSNAGSFEDPDYFPPGFVTFLWGAGGDDIVINCIKDSPTFGAVYFFQEGVGINRISGTLAEFIEGCTQELKEGLIHFEDADISEVVDEETYFDDRLRIYGNTPYFNRKGKMDTQIVDWK